MLTIQIFAIFLTIISAERPLPSYEKDVGKPPAWLKGTDQTNAAVERWYIDTSDATCKPFTYLGSLGNFNNFVSRSACNQHLKFTPEEQVNACASQKHQGNCGLKDGKMLTRWYFSKADVGGKTNTCHSFKYNGCGGNANNFETELDCKQTCQNKKNGGVLDSVADSELVPIPNPFDCKFIPEVKTAAPIMGIVPHKDGKKCVYAAVGATATRGFFPDLPTCVNTCISIHFKSNVGIFHLIEPLMRACEADEPYQEPSEQDVTSDVSIFYYFNKKEKLCLPFMSKTITKDTPKIDDGELNIFSSVEMCASFCPAINHIGPLTAVEACKLDKTGVTSGSDKYKINRFYYNHATTSGDKCTSFTFNGKEMNLNNFKDKTDCDAICTTPLTGSP